VSKWVGSTAVGSEETKSILLNREVIAIDQDSAGRQAHCLRQSGEQEIWSKPLVDGGVAVGLFNRGAAPAQISFTLAELHLAAGAKAQDLRAHSDVAISGGYLTTVPSHRVAMLRIQSK
jgi:alpha-galactosidase